MKEITKTIYIANNGEEFDDKEKCLAYEESLVNFDKTELIKAKELLRNYCRSHCCDDCIFSENSDSCCLQEYAPIDW